ncbi:MAG: 2-hydroxyacyl-CoA dehydratase [Clostridia bacterium]|jgi:benzoyl-CoA reductase subunit B|nr:2-hydroxyacyl-CoA dehydratase [Clostridia bacterium]
MAEPVNEIPKEFAEIFAGISRIYKENKNNPDARPFISWITVIKGLLEKDLSGIPIIYTNLGNSPELVLALGDSEGEVAPFGFEAIGATQGFFGSNQCNMDIIDLIEANGLSADVCSADKLALGYMLKKLLPPPVGGVFINTPCDSQIVAAEGFKSIMEVEPFIIDVPYSVGEKELHYVAKQLREQIKYLEQVTGKKLNWDRLKAICEENNRMVELLLEWSDWRKRTPCPQMSKVVTFGFVLLNTLSGTPMGTWYASELLEDAKERALAGKKAVLGEENVRAIWFGDPIWWNLPFYDWMEEELGMVIPMDLFGYVTAEAYIDTSSPDTILYTFARKLTRVMPMSRQLTGSAEMYIDDIISVYNQFNADCVIFPGNTGCKHMWGLLGLVREALRELDIPLLAFEFDLFDPRTKSEEDFKEDFRRFVNDIIIPRKNR